METPPALPLSFRPMTLADVARVHQIDQLSFSLPWSERSYRFEVQQNTSALAWVAEAAPALADARPGAPVGPAALVVGMIVIWAFVDEAHVATIATHPDFRGRGIARRLLAHGLLSAYQRGARMAYLEVRRSNLAARAMYARFGFQQVGERPGYYQDNHEDALLLTLDPIDPQALRALFDRP